MVGSLKLAQPASTQTTARKNPPTTTSARARGVQRSPVVAASLRASARSAAATASSRTPASARCCWKARSASRRRTRSAGVATASAPASCSAVTPSWLGSRTAPSARVAMPASGPPRAAASVGATALTTPVQSVVPILSSGKSAAPGPGGPTRRGRAARNEPQRPATNSAARAAQPAANAAWERSSVTSRP